MNFDLAVCFPPIVFHLLVHQSQNRLLTHCVLKGVQRKIASCSPSLSTSSGLLWAKRDQLAPRLLSKLSWSAWVRFVLQYLDTLFIQTLEEVLGRAPMINAYVGPEPQATSSLSGPPNAAGYHQRCAGGPARIMLSSVRRRRLMQTLIGARLRPYRAGTPRPEHLQDQESVDRGHRLHSQLDTPAQNRRRRFLVPAQIARAMVEATLNARYLVHL